MSSFDKKHFEENFVNGNRVFRVDDYQSLDDYLMGLNKIYGIDEIFNNDSGIKVNTADRLLPGSYTVTLVRTEDVKINFAPSESL